MKRCSFCEWIPILPWPVWPLAGQCSLGQNTVVGSMLCSSWLCVAACQKEYVGIPIFVTSELHHGSVQSYHLPDVPEELLNILAGWFDEEFPSILTEVLTQEIEAVLNRGEVGFRRRQFQPAFGQKLDHERFDLMFQEVSR